jgi:hypothetical protein
MIIFQLFVSGGSLAGWRINRYSKKVFPTHEAAEQYWPTFLALVSDPKEIDPLDLDAIEVQVIAELDLVNPYD